MNRKFWIGIAVSVIILYFLLRGIDFRKLWEASRKADIYYWIPAFLITYLLLFIRALRWRLLMEPIKDISVYSLFSATTIGFMANNVLPARMGEFVRAYVIGEKEGVSKTSSFATIVVERLFDGFAVLLLSIILFLFLPLPAEVESFRGTVRMSAIILTALYVVLLAFFYMLMNNREKAFSIARRFMSPLSERYREEGILLLGSFASGLDVLKNSHSLFMISLYSIVHWILAALPIHIVTLSFGHSPPFTAAILILVLLAFAVALPSSPGFIGPFHGAVYLGLGFYGINKEEAVSMAIIMHLANFAPIVILGFILLWKENLSLNTIKDIASPGDSQNARSPSDA